MRPQYLVASHMHNTRFTHPVPSYIRTYDSHMQNIYNIQNVSQRQMAFVAEASQNPHHHHQNVPHPVTSNTPRLTWYTSGTLTGCPLSATKPAIPAPQGIRSSLFVSSTLLCELTSNSCKHGTELNSCQPTQEVQKLQTQHCSVAVHTVKIVQKLSTQYREFSSCQYRFHTNVR